MKMMVSVSDETKRNLEDLADTDGIEAPKRAHQWLRKFVFDPPQQVPGGSSWVAQASALLARKEMRVGTQTFTAEELETGMKRFAIPDGGDAVAGPNEIEVVFSRRLGDALPMCLAYLDLGSTADGRRQRGWNNAREFVEFLVAGRAAEDKTKEDAREAEEEETALYPAKAKKSKKEKGDA